MEIPSLPTRLRHAVSPHRELIGAFILILLIRLVGAGSCSIWFDEIFTIKLASYPLWGIREFATQDVHPALYYYVVHCLLKLVQLLGIHHYPMIWLRLASILPNLALAGVLYVWSARRWGRRAGVASLLMVGLSSGMIYYSIELRNYSMSMLFILLSTLALVKLIAVPSVTWALAYTGATVLYLNLHYLTGLIYVGQVLFLAGHFLNRPKRAAPAAWLAQVLPHLLIGLLLLVQLPVIYGKFTNYYAPYHAYFYTPRPADLLFVFTYDYPAGAVVGLMPDSRYGRIAQLVFISFYLLLGYFIRKGAGRTRVSAESRLVEACCAWQLVFFLGLTWFVSMFNWAKLFFGWRSALLLLPLWILLMLTTIETRLQFHPRLVLRRVFVLLLLPGAVYGLYRRSALLDEFGGLREYARQAGAGPENDAHSMFYFDDQTVLPWVRSNCPDLNFKSLNDLVVAAGPPDAPLRVLTLLTLDARLRSPREAQTISFIRKWGREHNLPAKRFASVELIEVPHREAADFVHRLKEEIRSL